MPPASSAAALAIQRSAASRARLVDRGASMAKRRELGAHPGKRRVRIVQLAAKRGIGRTAVGRRDSAVFQVAFYARSLTPQRADVLVGRNRLHGRTV
jgi:hypothetical protein